MEPAFGTDFSGVRVHDDITAHSANVRLMARAFTTGNDIFFSRGTYRPSAPSGQRLIAHELAHVVQQGGAGTARRSMAGGGSVIRRDVHYGTDPNTLMQAGDKDLLYGLAVPRHQTMARMNAAQKDAIHTIDEYNLAVGINAIMTATDGAMGLYDIRAELASNAPWSLPLDAKYNTPTNAAAIQQWIALLRAHAAHIGLEDLGTKGGTFSQNKIDKKDRFKKNRRWSQAAEPAADRLTPSDTRRFLSPAHTKATAQAEYDNMSPGKQKALNFWVVTAFFRRTSKLGQTFAITTLGARLHMNTIADPDFDPKVGPKWHRHGLKTQSKRKNAKDRAITVSELRNLKKVAKQNPGSVNVYGEI